MKVYKSTYFQIKKKLKCFQCNPSRQQPSFNLFHEALKVSARNVSFLRGCVVKRLSLQTKFLILLVWGKFVAINSGIRVGLFVSSIPPTTVVTLLLLHFYHFSNLKTSSRSSSLLLQYFVAFWWNNLGFCNVLIVLPASYSTNRKKFQVEVLVSLCFSLYTLNLFYN